MICRNYYTFINNLEGIKPKYLVGTYLILKNSFIELQDKISRSIHEIKRNASPNTGNDR